MLCEPHTGFTSIRVSIYLAETGFSDVDAREKSVITGNIFKRRENPYFLPVSSEILFNRGHLILRISRYRCAKKRV